LKQDLHLELKQNRPFVLRLYFCVLIQDKIEHHFINNRLIVILTPKVITVHASHLVKTGYTFHERSGPSRDATHTEYTIVFLEQGKLKVKHGEEILVKPGMLVLVPAGTPHSVVESQNVGVRWLGFCASCLGLDESHAMMAPFQRIRMGALPVFELPKKRRTFLITLMQELQHESEQLRPDSYTVIKSLLLLILHETKKASNSVQTLNVNRSPVIARALTYIQKNSLNSISLKDVANAVHLSPAYLATTIKKGTGFSVGEWIMRNRLSEACSRLLHTDEDINTIAHQVGWNDVTHFIRQFKKAYQITPAAWRKKRN
jgi:AraC family transcriptional regulator, arabinose operon regulatory protein